MTTETVFDEAESFFAGEDYDNVDVNPYALDEGTHNVTVTAAEIVAKQDGSKAFVVTFTADGPKTYQEWLNPVKPGDDDKVKQAILRQRVTLLTELGVPRSRIATVRGPELIGITGNLTISKNKQGYMKFRKFEVTEGGSVGEPLLKGDGLDEFKPSTNGTEKVDLKSFGI